MSWTGCEPSYAVRLTTVTGTTLDSRKKADPQVLAYQYLQTLPQLAQAQGSTFRVIPSEVTTVLKTLSSAFSSDSAGPPAMPQAGPGTVRGAAAVLPGDGPLPPGPGVDGDVTRAGTSAG